MPRRDDIKKVMIIGVEADAIERGEDRIEFKKTMERLGIELQEYHASIR